MNLLLKARHWQVFMITFALPLTLQVFMVPILSMGKHPALTMELLLTSILCLTLGGYLGWLWTTVSELQAKIPVTLKMNLAPFKVMIILLLAYLLIMIRFIVFVCESIASLLKIIFTLLMALFGGSLNGITTPHTGIFDILLNMIVPMQFLLIIGILYCIYVTAKTIKTAQLQRPAVFSDYAEELFLIWLFPVGIWIIQPKLNKMVKDVAPPTNNNLLN